MHGQEAALYTALSRGKTPGQISSPGLENAKQEILQQEATRSRAIKRQGQCPLPKGQDLPGGI